MPSNDRNEPMIHPCHDFESDSNASKLCDAKPGLTAEVISERGDMLADCF